MQDAIDVMDACGVECAIGVGLSTGAQRGMLLAAEHPERVERMVFIGPMFPVSAFASLRMRALAHPRIRPLGTKPPITTRGWGKVNPFYWCNGGYGDFVQWWADKMLTEPHSTKQIEDAIAWSHETDGPTLALSVQNQFAVPATRKDQTALAERIQCPVLVIHGTEDQITPYADGKALAKITGGRLETVEGAGHLPHARKPVQVNLALREFVEGVPRRRDPTVHRSGGRKRALYISSPIGLGHAQRDVAIAGELRKLVPGCEIDWLAQPPVTRVLASDGERIHPAARTSRASPATSSPSPPSTTCTASRPSAAWTRSWSTTSWSSTTSSRDEPYDLWIGDEAWELDYFLHENPASSSGRRTRG